MLAFGIVVRARTRNGGSCNRVSGSLKQTWWSRAADPAAAAGVGAGVLGGPVGEDGPIVRVFDSYPSEARPAEEQSMTNFTVTEPSFYVFSH